MPKVVYVPEKKLNPADELRTLLTALEERHVRLKLLGETQATDILRDMDRAVQLFADLQASGLDLTPEAGRFEAFQNRLRRSAGLLLRRLGGASALRRARPDPAPDPATHWWWYIDELVARQRRQTLRRLAIVAGVVLVILAGVWLVFQTILAPDPLVVARVEAENEANFALEAGDMQAALAALDAGLEKVPNDPNLLLFKAVLLDALGQPEQAAPLLVQARQAITDPVAFNLHRAQLEMRVDLPAQAEQHIREVLEKVPDSANGWLLLAQSLEAQQKYPEAVAAYQKASELAEAQNNEEIVVLARVSLAQLQMKMMSPPVNEGQ
ncbi:MAG: hypothetical protein D6784_03685 [Chloroflexi bacterium]|nr:MAG: hypothetical protein D6784_03685 [Chloroflexota bacterium]